MLTPETGAPLRWKNGWLESANHLPSPNFGARPDGENISLILLHSISLPPGEYGGNSVAKLFTNTLDWDAHPYFGQIRGVEVSSHFFIRRDGELVQFVSCDDRAWHAGKSSFLNRDNCNDYSVGVELEGLEGQIFEEAQYLTLAKLCSDIRLAYPIQHISAHSDVAPGRKFDPGDGFLWPRLKKDLGWDSRYFPLHV